MTFTEVFGGTTIYPSGVSYRAIALSANQTLAWPVETATNGNVVAQIMDVTPSVGSLSIIMPPANEVSVGETTLFFNPGGFTFTVRDNGGNTIVAIAPGLSYQVYLIGNSTVNGTWRSTQYAAGTSSATAGSLVGAGIKAINTTLNQSMNVTTLNSNYAIGDADRSGAFVWTGGAGAFTLPASGTVGNDWFCQIRNGGTGAVTLTPTGSELINGASNLTFNPGDSAIVICDGSSFFTIGFGQSAAFAFDYVSIDLSSPVTSPYTLSGANLNRIAYRFGGTLTANMQVLIPATIQQYWISNDTSGSFSLTVKVSGQTGVVIPQGSRGIYYCNGTDIIDADTASFAFPLTVAQGGTGATTESGARINLGGTSVGIGVFTAVTAADGRNALTAAKSGANSDITSLTGLTTPLTVPQGGTGVATLTANGVVLGNGGSALSATAVGTTGQVLVGNTGAAPSWATLTGIGVTSFSAGTTGFTPSTATTGAITLAGTLGVANGGTGTTTAFTAGSVVFAGASGVYSQDNANFFWDDTNNRLGIGTATPSIKLQVSDVDQATARIGVNNVNGQNYHLVAGVPGLSNSGFAIFDATASATRMYLDSSGNFGIGITTPVSYAGYGNLTVNGTSGGTLTLRNSANTNSSEMAATASEVYLKSVVATPLWFGTNNTEKMRITATGDVGIGTSSPATKLDVVNSGVSQIQIQNTSGTTKNTQLMFADNVGSKWRIGMDVATNNNTNNFQLYNDAASAAALTVDSSSNVGIGTTTPQQKFVVSNAGAGGIEIIPTGVIQSYNRSTSAYQALNYDASVHVLRLGVTEAMRVDSNGRVGIGTSTPPGKFSVASVPGTVGFNVGTSSSPERGNLWYDTDDSGWKFNIGKLVGSTFTTQMTFQDNGNVGIGTSSPGARLDIRHNQAAYSYFDYYNETTGGGIVWRQIYRNIANTGNATIDFAKLIGGGFALNNTDTNAANYTSFSVGASERMRIDSSGNVGIGTSSPTQKLDVRGAIASVGASGVNAIIMGDLGATAGTFSIAAVTGRSLKFTDDYAGAERMRIDSSGNFLVGKTSLSDPTTTDGVIVYKNASGGGTGTYLTNGGTGTALAVSTQGDTGAVIFFRSGTQVGSISVTTTATTYNTSSDYRLKKIDGPIANSGAYIDALNPVQGSWKADGSRFIGLLAHEVQEVSETPIATGEKDGEEMQAMDYSAPELIANLIAELQSLRARVAQLEGN
jgi:hypothetical protein